MHGIHARIDFSGRIIDEAADIIFVFDKRAVPNIAESIVRAVSHHPAAGICRCEHFAVFSRSDIPDYSFCR